MAALLSIGRVGNAARDDHGNATPDCLCWESLSWVCRCCNTADMRVPGRAMSASLRRDSKALGYRTRSCERREIARRRAEEGASGGVLPL